MAKRYPHADVTGVDLAPVSFDETLLPPNAHFEIDDINNGLGHFHNKFDVIHMRCVLGGISDPDKTLNEIQLCLKPGGLVIFIDGDIEIYGEDRLHRVKIPDLANEGPDAQGSWFRKVVWGELSWLKNNIHPYLFWQRLTRLTRLPGRVAIVVSI